MAMHGAVAAQDERRIGLVGGIEFVADKQVDARHFEGPDVVLSGDRSKQVNSAHRATFAHVSAYARLICPPERSFGRASERTSVEGPAPSAAERPPPSTGHLHL